MNTHTLISGETIQYEPKTSDVAAFLDRVAAAAADPAVGVVQLEAIVYGLDNPMLATDVLPGRAVVTKRAYEDSCFHVMLDLIGRKRVATGSLDLAAARARHTITVQDAAKRLGITEGAVRQAIHAGRLACWREGGTYYLDPHVVAAYRVSRRGPPPASSNAATGEARRPARSLVADPLEVRCGSDAETTFNVKAPRELSARAKHGHVVTGLAEGWKRVYILASRGKGARLFTIVPSKTPNKIELGGFFVRGKFDVLEVENNGRRARERFKASVAE